MAVVTTKANAITNADAQPRVLNDGRIAGGEVREHVGTVEAVSGDSIASIYRLARIKSSDRVAAVRLYCDAITTCAGDVGLYRTTDDGAAVVDADFFASAQSLASAILTGTDITYESAAGPADVSKIEQPIWQLLGLTADPGLLYDIAVTLTAAAGSAGTVSLRVTVVNQA